MNNYNNACTEVCAILECLDEIEYAKIPFEIIEAIKLNQNKNYNYEVEDVELKYQKMLPETKAILFNLFRDYLSTSEQKEKIIKMQSEERRKNEIKKQQIYNKNIFEDRQLTDSKEKQIQIIKCEENILKKIFNKIKSFFSR